MLSLHQRARVCVRVKHVSLFFLNRCDIRVNALCDRSCVHRDIHSILFDISTDPGRVLYSIDKLADFVFFNLICNRLDLLISFKKIEHSTPQVRSGYYLFYFSLSTYSPKVYVPVFWNDTWVFSELAKIFFIFLFVLIIVIFSSQNRKLMREKINCV